jgi:MFS family permease
VTALTVAAQRRVPRLLREPHFRRYWWAQTISLFGDQISLLALPLAAVLVADAGPAEMGYLTAAGLVPSLMFSLVAGAWADGKPYKRRIMIVADLGRAAAIVAIPLLYAFGALTMTQLYVVAFVVGALSVLFEVCRTTLFVSLVDKADYIPANALINGSRALSFVGGPAVAGPLVQVLTAPVALVADALSYLYSGWLLARTKAVEPAPSRAPGLGIGSGLRYYAGQPVLRAMLMASTVVNLFNYMFWALIVLYAVSYLHITPAVLGLVIGAASLGALVGAAVTNRLATRIGVGPALLLSYVLFPAPLILLPIANGASVPVAVGAFFLAEFVSGFGVMVLDIMSGSIQTAVIPDDMRARIAGAHRTVNYGIRPIGALLGGALGASIGVVPTLWVATVGAMVAVLFLVPSPIPRMRQL